MSGAIRHLAPGDGAYPEQLRSLPTPPPLYYFGALEALGERAIAIVGSRRASEPDLELAFELARLAAARDVVVVSGLARGVDAAAHRGALAGGGRTVAVLPGGVDRITPAAHRQLAAEIAGKRGCLLSEMEPGTDPKPYMFVRRNHLQAALARAVVCIASEPDGGTMHTANFARRLERALWVPDSGGGEGVRILRDRPGHELAGASVPFAKTKDLGAAPLARGFERADPGALFDELGF